MIPSLSAGGVIRSLLLIFLFLASGLLPTVRGQEVTSQQRRELSSIKTSLRRAALLHERGRTNDAANMAREAQQRLVAMLQGAGEPLREQAKSTYDMLVRLRGELQFEGATLPPLPALDEMEGGIGDGISFVKQVAPILVGKCGRCHIERSQGQFSMASFEALSRGTPAGVVFFPGDARASRLIEVIETGDMPRGGTKLTEQELDTLKRWIAAGAVFDGEDPKANLATLSGNDEPAEPQAALEVTMSTGKEKVQFSRDIAPVLAEACVNCHGDGQQVRGRLNLTSFRSMVRGGDSGTPWVPGRSEQSLLWKKLQGTADGQRMPAGRPPLSDEQLKLFATWIDEGATYDAADTDQHVTEVAAVSKARLASHAQLMADRAQLAQRNWRLVMPDSPPEQLDSTNFLLLGNVGDVALEEYRVLAESLVPRVARLFRVSSGDPLVKGRVTLYFFRRQYDYGEFGQMVEKRSLPASWRSHWRYSTVDAYGVNYPPADDEDALAARLAEQIAGTYVASCGSSPRWFREGVARAAAAKLFPGDDRVRRWLEQLTAIRARMNKADDFLAGKLGPDEAVIVQYGFAAMLMSDSRRFQRLLGELREGTAFENAFRQAYGDTPAQVAEIWARQPRRRSG